MTLLIRLAMLSIIPIGTGAMINHTENKINELNRIRQRKQELNNMIRKQELNN